MDDGDSASPSQLASAQTVAISGAVVILLTLTKIPQKGYTRLVTIVPVVVAVLSRVWVHVASHFVPEPYLASYPQPQYSTRMDVDDF